MAWEINGTDQFADWFGALDVSVQDEVIAVVELLAEHGPQLDRPYADRIAGSKYHNMKELRPRGRAHNCRILFMFDPQRQAIPEAERLYEEYLAELRSEGLLDDD